MAETTRKKLIEPQTLKGFQDFLPEDMIARDVVIEKIKKVYQKYGFLPLDTPILEYLSTLIGTGGEEINKELFQLESPEGDLIAMRFDLTVPFARLIAQYSIELGLPFRRYHIGPVFRADKPSPGRFRQFTQFDIDAAGSESIAVDAEIIAVITEVMRELGLNNYESNNNIVQEFQVKINNRKLVDVLLEGCGIEDIGKHKHVLRIIDKLQKVGIENVCKELGEGRIDESGDPIPGAGLSSSIIDKIIVFISTKGSSRKEVIESLESQLQDSEKTRSALQEMYELADALNCLNVKEYDAVFDPSLTRGLDYYTGPVFETHLLQVPELGSVMGGGRFDQLVERFSDNKVPCTGASIGLDRLMVALVKLGKIEKVATTTKVLVLSMRGIPNNELLKVASELRQANIPTEIYFGKQGASIKDQLSFANMKRIPIAVILGEDELKANKISVKDLEIGMKQREGIIDREEYRKAGKVGQVTIEREKLIQTVMAILNKNKL